MGLGNCINCGKPVKPGHAYTLKNDTVAHTFSCDAPDATDYGREAKTITFDDGKEGKRRMRSDD